MYRCCSRHSPAVFMAKNVNCHFNCAAYAPKTALRFRHKIYMHDICQHFDCHTEKGDATTVATFCSITLLLVYKNIVGAFPLVWATLGRPAVKDKDIDHTHHT